MLLMHLKKPSNFLPTKNSTFFFPRLVIDLILQFHEENKKNWSWQQCCKEKIVLLTVQQKHPKIKITDKRWAVQSLEVKEGQFSKSANPQNFILAHNKAQDHIFPCSWMTVRYINEKEINQCRIFKQTEFFQRNWFTCELHQIFQSYYRHWMIL